MKYREALEKVKECGQEHVLEFFEELSAEQQQALLQQTDFMEHRHSSQHSIFSHCNSVRHIR